MLSARKLELTTKELNALIRVRDGLASGEYRHVKDTNAKSKSGKRGFNMIHWLDKSDCGTVGCIGGWCERELKGNSIGMIHTWGSVSERRWSELTHPTGNVDWCAITPAKAAKGIDNFLNGVEPWDFMRPKSERRAA